jgi:hypothetical protein
MTRFLFAAALGWPEAEILPRLRELELSEPCARCQGTGFYTTVVRERSPETRCFGCLGKCDQLPKLTLELARTAAVRIVKGGLDPYLARRARRRQSVSLLRPLLYECHALAHSVGTREALELYVGPSAPVLPAPPPLAVKRVWEMVCSGEMDPETAEVALRSLRERLQALAAA